MNTEKVKNLAIYIEAQRKRLNALLKNFNWHAEDIVNSTEVQNCTAYTAVDELPQNFNTTNSITLTETQLCEVLNRKTAKIPITFTDLQSNFNRAEKLKIYEYVIENTDKMIDPMTDTECLKKSKLSFAEIVAIKKKERTNRRRHRTSKTSHTEEVRALVQLQMDALKQFLDDNEKQKFIKNERISKYDDAHASRKTCKEINDEYKDKKRKFKKRSRSRSAKRKNKHKEKTHKMKKTKHHRSRSRNRSQSQSQSQSRNRNRSRSRSPYKSKYEEKELRERERQRYRTHRHCSRSRSREHHRKIKIHK